MARAAQLTTPSSEVLDALREAACDSTYVSMGSRRTTTIHEFYRYPARFSPRFVRAAIAAFTSPGDVILDPFVGGGTTVAEAMLMGRRSVGADINPLAVFVARTKTLTHTTSSLSAVESWLDTVSTQMNVRGPRADDEAWYEDGYLRHLDGHDTWRIRKIIGQALVGLDSIRGSAARDLARLVVLRTAQWALDMRSEVPSVSEFRGKLVAAGRPMLEVARSFASDTTAAFGSKVAADDVRTIIEQRIDGLASHPGLAGASPVLTLTSPPYPGVYVLYHRWKLRGRLETAAPFWIADRRDGHGIAHYTMAAKAPTLDRYFTALAKGFAEVAAIAPPGSWCVQMVGFGDVAEQLPRYIEAMYRVGFDEVMFDGLANADDGRCWRHVPSRRWWVTSATKQGTATHTANEVVLVFRRSARTLQRP